MWKAFSERAPSSPLSYRPRWGTQSARVEAETILVVEDDEAIRESLTEILEFEGYSVATAQNGEEALGILASDTVPPALVLLDLSMPIMNGPTFLQERKRRFPGLDAMPIVILTAAGPGEIPESHPAERVLRKPIDLDRLLGKINEVMEGAQLRVR